MYSYLHASYEGLANERTESSERVMLSTSGDIQIQGQGSRSGFEVRVSTGFVRVPSRHRPSRAKF